jgi:F-type H+-transporting ATPase subunit epsilon
MAENVLTLEVATPLGLVLNAKVDNVQAPSVNGEFGVLPGHLPLLAAMKPGVLRYRVGNQLSVAAVSAGFVEAGSDKVLMLTDAFLAPKDIDDAAVRGELERAEADLAGYGQEYEGREFEELQRRIDWARARLDAKGESSRG